MLTVGGRTVAYIVCCDVDVGLVLRYMRGQVRRRVRQRGPTCRVADAVASQRLLHPSQCRLFDRSGGEDGRAVGEAGVIERYDGSPRDERGETTRRDRMHAPDSVVWARRPTSPD
jgi:hypothetical protein